MTITVYDPKFSNPRYRRLQKHESLAPDVAREMVAVYAVLGYPKDYIEITDDFEATEAENAAA